MPRYFVKMAYDGTNFHGWARQPFDVTVQQTVEEALSTIYRKPIEVSGCGRTDTGVHASCFYFHVDLESIAKNFIFRLNSLLPQSIVFYDIFEVDEDAHARFDATERSYQFLAHARKSPFRNNFSSRIIEFKHVTVEQLNEVPKLLLNYNEFFPFCKTHADSKTNICDLRKCEWSYKDETEQFVLDVVSDRFLRGMIRLIVGTCLLVSIDRLDINDVKLAMENQERMPKNLSAPADGLFLNNILYPYIN